MSTTGTELEAFRQFIDFQIASGRTDLTPEQSLTMWRENSGEFSESVAAVKRALADLDAGDRGKPLSQVVGEIRAKFQIPADA